ncbi:MAG: peptidoglycan-binding protein LysM [Nitrospirota bacterium]|nr:MAG: peptidoglycan-binding protein LysM [Nitrospirota bacterium]
MGLFDFVKSVGEKVFGREDDPAQKIKEHIKSRNPGIKDLNVDFTDGQVSLSGNANNAEAMEKAVLLAGNVQGVGDVTAEKIQVPEQKAKVEYNVIQSGDTLSKIAKQYLGDAMAYPKIFEATREVIKDANLIYPSQKILIPL